MLAKLSRTVIILPELLAANYIVVYYFFLPSSVNRFTAACTSSHARIAMHDVCDECKNTKYQLSVAYYSSLLDLRLS